MKKISVLVLMVVLLAIPILSGCKPAVVAEGELVSYGMTDDWVKSG